MMDDDDTDWVAEIKAILHLEGGRKAQFETCLQKLSEQGVYSNHEQLISVIDVIFRKLWPQEGTGPQGLQQFVVMQICLDCRTLEHYIHDLETCDAN